MMVMEWTILFYIKHNNMYQETTPKQERVSEACEIATNSSTSEAYDILLQFFEGELGSVLKSYVDDAIYDACKGKQGLIDEMDDDFDYIKDVVVDKFNNYLKQKLL